MGAMEKLTTENSYAMKIKELVPTLGDIISSLCAALASLRKMNVNGNTRHYLTICYLNKRECNLNQSKDCSFVERVAKNNS